MTSDPGLNGVLEPANPLVERTYPERCSAQLSAARNDRQHPHPQTVVLDDDDGSGVQILTY